MHNYLDCPSCLVSFLVFKVLYFYLFIFICRFGVSPRDAQGLFLALTLGITPGGAWETIGDARDRIPVKACAANILTAVLSFQPPGAQSILD